MLKKAFAISALLLGLGLYQPAFAVDQLPTTGASNPIPAGDVKLLVPLPGVTQIPRDPGEYVKALFLYGIGLAALLALVQLAIGAVQYTSSAGFPALQEAAKGRIQSSIIGLILLLGAVSILLMFYQSGTRDLNALETNQPVTLPTGEKIAASALEGALASHTAILAAKPDYKQLEEGIIRDITDPSLTMDQRMAKARQWEAVLHPYEKYTNGQPIGGDVSSLDTTKLLLNTMPAGYAYIDNGSSGYGINRKLGEVAFQAAVEDIALNNPAIYSALDNDGTGNARTKGLRFNWMGYNPGKYEDLMAEKQMPFK